MSAKDVAHHVITYRNVFILLLICTGLTVGAAYVDFNVPKSMAGALFVGLTIAIFKGYLVAGNFMHLKTEKKIIHYILFLTVFFLFVLLAIPVLWHINLVK
jgi:caa(3)-type oxidase subunit IV